jgi:hypothetical protein
MHVDETGATLMATALQRTTEALFVEKVGVPLPDYVTRSRGAGNSWRLIARELEDATGGVVQLTDVTLINWYGDRSEAGVA